MGKQKKERPWLNCPTEREWAIAKLWDPEMSDTEWAHVLKVLRPILEEPERQRKCIWEVLGVMQRIQMRRLVGSCSLYILLFFGSGDRMGRIGMRSFFSVLVHF